LSVDRTLLICSAKSLVAKSKKSGSDPTVFGFLNIRKPLGITAHDVVARLRRITGMKQVGHGGTLDPMAEGVLPIAVGKATRLLRFLEGRKVYLAELRLGTRTATDDMQGEILSAVGEDFIYPGAAEVSAELRSFVGDLQQIPPMYSAVHVDGQRLYAMARAGATADDVQVAPRAVHVESIDELDYTPPIIRVRIACGAGTYIRSIARDLGEKLGCGGTLQSLIREQAGPFNIESSVTLDKLAEGPWLEHLLPPQMAISQNRISVTDEEAKKLCLGQSITAEVPPAQQYVIAMYKDNLVAVCRTESLDSASVRIQPEVVLFDGQQSK
jgi:tRNA pseudouridine55 synthase